MLWLQDYMSQIVNSVAEKIGVLVELDGLRATETLLEL